MHKYTAIYIAIIHRKYTYFFIHRYTYLYKIARLT